MKILVILIGNARGGEDTLNSYFILNIGLNDNLKSAILMNVTAFLMYYTFERMFNNIKWGKVGDKK